MILIITAQDSKLESPVERRFGRCPWFIKMDTETNQWEAFANPGINLSGGAGVAAAQFVVDKKADAVISGDFGPNAFGAFQAAGIKMIRFNDGITTVDDAVQKFNKGELK